MVVEEGPHRIRCQLWLLKEGHTHRVHDCVQVRHSVTTPSASQSRDSRPRSSRSGHQGGSGAAQAGVSEAPTQSHHLRDPHEAELLKLLLAQVGEVDAHPALGVGLDKLCENLEGTGVSRELLLSLRGVDLFHLVVSVCPAEWWSVLTSPMCSMTALACSLMGASEGWLLREP